MYFYLYDAFLRDRKYERALAKIESRLLTLGLNGKSEKLTLLKSMRDLVDSAKKRGADTIVAIGDDQTMSKIIGLLADDDVTLGCIPLGQHLRLAEYLGIPEGVGACDVLSSRIVEHLDLGKANDSYFLSFLDLDPSKELLIDCEKGQYHIEPQGEAHHVSVHNFGGMGIDPRDGKLELVVQQADGKEDRGFGKKKRAKPTILSLSTMKIKSFGRSVAAHADGQTVIKTPMTVQVVPKKLRIIVGKNRKFA